MKDNLARKPELTLVNWGRQEMAPKADIVPESSAPPAPKDKRRWWFFSPEASLWLSSLGIVVLAYVAPLVWWLWSDNAPGANLPPPAAMVVELAPAPVAPPVPAEQPPGPEQPEATPPPEPEPEPEPLPEREPELPLVPVADEPEVAINPVAEPPPEEVPIVAEPPPSEPEEPVEEAPPLEDVTPSSASAPPEAPQEDILAAAPNQGMPTPMVDHNRRMNWQSSLMLKLDEAKRYPASARRQRQEGVAYLRFAMDREGAVLSASVEQSSGYSLLDEETLSLIERAQPLPVPPEDIQGEALEFVVPVEFFLNR